MAIVKATEIAGAPSVLAVEQLNRRERKVLEVAEQYAPTTASDWDVTPSEIGDALDEVASRINTAEDTIAAYEVLEAVVSVADFSATGITAAGELDTGIELPDNAVVVEVFINSTADSTSSGGTIQLLVGTGGTAISSALAADGTDNVEISSTGLGTKTTAATNLFLTAATEDTDAGAYKAVVRYFVGL